MSRCFLLLVAAVFAATTEGAQFDLVKNGAACALIELSGLKDAKTVKCATADIALFNRHLKEVTGVELPIASQGESWTGNRIRVELKPIAALDTRYEWNIAFPSQNLMRVEATATSLFTALRQLIEEGCDARFLGTERCMFQYEPRRSVSVEIRGRRNAAKNFTLLRDIYGTKGHRRELGLTDDGLFKYTHGIPVYAFPGDMYNAKGWPKEILPELKGRRIEYPPDLYNRWQPCYSNPETARIATENIRAWLRKNPGAMSITLGVNDNGGYCQCSGCRAMDGGSEKSVFSNDPENHSASYYTFVNRIAEALSPEFPDLRIGLLAYTGTIMPPKFPVHPNVVPMMTFDTLSAGMDPEVCAAHEQVIRRWGKKVRETGIWDYSWGGGYFIPRVDFEGHARRIKLLYECGGRAYFGENSMPDALDGPKTYLISRLLENVDASADVILKEWFVRFAGAAAEKPLREIYRRCAEYWRSEPMKRSALWSARRYIYNYPYANQFFALMPHFTERLADLANEVCGRAVSDGEKRRAEILLRHIERLDCIASFKGIAYMSPASGELESAADAAKMLDDFASRSAGLFEAWKRVRNYFVEAPDFDRKKVYSRAPYEAVPLLAEQFGKAAGFRDDPAVAAALKRIAALECLPPDVRRLLKNIFSGRSENCFSNPGFAKDRAAMRIKTTLPYETVDDMSFDGGRALKIMPGRPDGDPDPRDAVLRQVSAFTFTENLAPGLYMVSMKVRAEGTAEAKGDLAVWRQTDGGDRDWEGWRPAQLKNGEAHTFVQVRQVKDVEDGLNLKLRVSGFGKDDALYVGDVKILKIAEGGAGGRTRAPSLDGVTARKGAVRETLFGEKAVVCGSDAYAFAHVMVNVPRILPQETLSFTLRTAMPEGAKTGRLGAIIFKPKKGGGWEQQKTLVWNHRPSDKGWKNVDFGISGKDLGKKRGKYLLIFFKMKDTDAVAFSQIGWKVEPNNPR